VTLAKFINAERILFDIHVFTLIAGEHLFPTADRAAKENLSLAISAQRQLGGVLPTQLSRATFF
jgi:hypothetical protein